MSVTHPTLWIVQYKLVKLNSGLVHQISLKTNPPPPPSPPPFELYLTFFLNISFLCQPLRPLHSRDVGPHVNSIWTDLFFFVVLWQRHWKISVGMLIPAPLPLLHFSFSINVSLPDRISGSFYEYTYLYIQMQF